MKFVLMCGGYYEQWETPKQLQIVNGERIVERTIRLLKENGVKDIVITSNNPVFDELGVPRLEHENSYRYENGKLNGYWLDAFYPKFRKNQKATFVFGDVYFTEDAIKEIQYINKIEEKNSLYKEQRATLKTIKAILYKHALESEFQLADEVFIKQIQLLNELFDTYWERRAEKSDRQ